MSILFANNVNMQLASDLGATDTSFSVIAGQGSQCPEIATDSTDYMLLTIIDKDGNREIVKIIEHEADSDTFTIGDDTSVPHAASTDGRAYEATYNGYQTALAITASDSHKIILAATAASLEEALAFSAVTSSVAELSTLHSSGITNADLVKLHAITLTAAQINGAIPPVGSIMAYVPGYFTDGSNAGFTYQMVSANTVAAVDTLLNSSGWYVCSGAALNDSDSGIFNGSGRYLPNLTDDRFLMGDTVAGGTGGANSNDISHVHTTSGHTLTTDEIPAHTHTYDKPVSGSTVLSVGVNYARVTVTSAQASGSAGGGSAHEHGDTGSAGSETLENRPTYLSCFYIMRVH